MGAGCSPRQANSCAHVLTPGRRLCARHRRRGPARAPKADTRRHHGSRSPCPQASRDLSQRPLPGHNDCLRSTFPLREMGLKASFLLGSLLTGLRAPAGSRRDPRLLFPPHCVCNRVRELAHTQAVRAARRPSVRAVSTRALPYPRVNGHGALGPARLPMGCRPCLRPRAAQQPWVWEAHFPPTWFPLGSGLWGWSRRAGRVLRTNSGFPLMVSIPRSSLSLGEPLATLLFRPGFASCSLWRP